MTNPISFRVAHTFTLSPNWTVTPTLGGSVRGYDATPRWGMLTLGWAW